MSEATNVPPVIWNLQYMQTGSIRAHCQGGRQPGTRWMVHNFHYIWDIIFQLLKKEKYYFLDIQVNFGAGIYSNLDLKLETWRALSEVTSVYFLRFGRSVSAHIACNRGVSRSAKYWFPPLGECIGFHCSFLYINIKSFISFWFI